MVAFVVRWASRAELTGVARVSELSMNGFAAVAQAQTGCAAFDLVSKETHGRSVAEFCGQARFLSIDVKSLIVCACRTTPELLDSVW